MDRIIGRCNRYINFMTFLSSHVSQVTGQLFGDGGAGFFGGLVYISGFTMVSFIGKGRIWISTIKNTGTIASYSTFIYIFAFSSIVNQVNCEVTVFKGDPIRPKPVDMDEIRKLMFVNRPRQPRQDDGDDGGEEETATMMPGLGAVLNNLFGSNSALAQFPQIIRTFSSIGNALNMALGGNANGGTNGLPNFLVRQSNQTGNIFQQITGSSGQGPQSILQILEANRRPIGGVIPNRERPGAANGAAAAQEQMELLLMTMMMMQQSQQGGVQGASGKYPASGQAVGAPSVNPDLQNQLVQLAIQQQTQQLLNGMGAVGPPEDYSIEDFEKTSFPTEAPQKQPAATPRAPVAAPSAPVAAPSAPVAAPSAQVAPPSAPVAAPSAPVVAPSAPVAPIRPLLAPPKTSAASQPPQITKEIAHLASKLPNQATNSSDTEIIPNLWELYAMLQTLPQFQPTPSPSISQSPPTPMDLKLFHQAISQYPALFSLALLQSINAANAVMQNKPQKQPPFQIHPELTWKPPTSSPSFTLNPPPKQQQQTNPQLAWKPPTPSPSFNPDPYPTQNPTWTLPTTNELYSPNKSPASPIAPPKPDRPPSPIAPPKPDRPPSPIRRQPQYPTTPFPSMSFPAPENTHIYTGSLHALKAQNQNQRPEEDPSSQLNVQGPHFVKSPTSSQFTLPIGGYVPSVVSVFEGVESQKPVGPQPDNFDDVNGFGHKAPYTPIKSGILIDTPRLQHSPHDLVRKPSGGLVINTQEKQTSGIFPENSQKYPDGAFQGTNVNSIRLQQQQQQNQISNQNLYGAVHTTTTTRRPPPPSPQASPLSPQASPSASSSSWIAAIKEIERRPGTTPKPYRTRPTTKKPSLISGPIYWMNMFYPKGVSTEKSSYL